MTQGTRQSADKVQWIRRAVLLFLAMALDVFLFSDAITPDPPDLLGPRTSSEGIVIYALVGYGLLLFQSRARFSILFVLCAYSAVAALAMSYRPIIPVCIALAVAAAHVPIRQGVAAFVAAALTAVTWVYSEDRSYDFYFSWIEFLTVYITYLAFVTVAGGIGWWRQVSGLELERRRAEAARSAVTTERRRVARELHDIVAHAVTLMVLQASGARAVMPTDVERAQAALEVVERTGTQAMSELRRLLSVLRSDASQDDQSIGGKLPPGLDALPALVESIRATGVEVGVHTYGTPRPIDQSVDAAAYRVVSESLTNVTKHSGRGASAEVQLKWSEDQLDIDISDDGRGSGSDETLSTGNGLLGLTERVVLVGGAFVTRPRPTGGYEVHAVLPLSTPDLTEAAVLAS